MELRQIEYFVAVADQRGVRAASTATGYAQGTISTGIANLERNLGSMLFHRIGQGAILTSAGHALLGPARRMLRTAVEAEGSLPGSGGVPRGRIDVFALPSLIAGPVTSLIARFRKRYAQTPVRVGEFRDEADVKRLLQSGDCEIVICHLPTSGVDELTVFQLGLQEHWLVCPPGTRLPDHDPLPITSLRKLPMVAVPSGGSHLDEIGVALSALESPFPPSAILPRSEPRLPFVLAGVGSTLLDRVAAEQSIQFGAVVRALDPPIMRPYGLIYDNSTLSPAARTFVTVALELNC